MEWDFLKKKIFYFWTIWRGIFYQAHNILNKETEREAQNNGKVTNKEMTRIWQEINYQTWEKRIKYYNSLEEGSLQGITEGIEVLIAEIHRRDKQMRGNNWNTTRSGLNLQRQKK